MVPALKRYSRTAGMLLSAGEDSMASTSFSKTFAFRPVLLQHPRDRGARDLPNGIVPASLDR